MPNAEFENPLSEGLRIERKPDPSIVVIFGASGDLTRRKLVPALYNLARQNLLPAGFSILGTGRTALGHDGFRERMKDAVTSGAGLDHEVWKNFAAGIFYQPTDSNDPKSFDALNRQVSLIDDERGTAGNRLYYLSTPPSLYAPIVQTLGLTGLNRSSGWSRIIVEKPFGRDLPSMATLNKKILEVFSEDQVYRIDHYLGKETVQNIMVLRFSNGIFEPLWNRRYVDHVQITAAENLGVEDRGGYYEQSGVLRDMIQNHLFQVFALVAMEPPASMDAGAVRDEKAKVISAVRPFSEQQIEQCVVRGQYTTGSVNGTTVVGYREEKEVDSQSGTETYAALKLLVDNWRWADVPFYLRSGKRLPKRVTEVAITFRSAPHLLFKHAGPLQPNTLIVRIQPDEGISLRFDAKLPGPDVRIRPVNMDFRYGTSFGKPSPEAYERLLLDAMLGDSTLFARSDTLSISWELLTPILEAWAEPVAEVPLYESGSWGPSEADGLLQRDGRRWRRP